MLKHPKNVRRADLAPEILIGDAYRTVRTELPELLFGEGTPRKAALTALVVGTVLTGINHGDTILAGDYPPVFKVILTYCVPYCVTSWGAATGKLAQYRANQTEQIERQERRE